MKRNQIYFIGALIIVFIGFIYHSIPSDESVNISIKTSTHCGACKKAIESALREVDGVVSSDVVISKSVVNVKYEPNEINPDEIRSVISNTGYNADKIKADQQAYDKLPDCCKNT